MFRKILRGEWLKSDSCLTTPHHWTPCSLPCPSARFKASHTYVMRKLVIQTHNRQLLTNLCSWNLLFQQLHPDTDDSVSEADEEEVIPLSTYFQRSKILYFNLALSRECTMMQKRMLVPMVMPMAVEEGRRAWTPNSTTQSTVTRTSATPTSTTQHQWNNRYLGNEKVNSWLVSSAIQLSIYTWFGLSDFFVMHPDFCSK